MGGEWVEANGTLRLGATGGGFLWVWPGCIGDLGTESMDKDVQLAFMMLYDVKRVLGIYSQ